MISTCFPSNTRSAPGELPFKTAVNPPKDRRFGDERCPREKKSMHTLSSRATIQDPQRSYRVADFYFLVHYRERVGDIQSKTFSENSVKLFGSSEWPTACVSYKCRRTARPMTLALPERFKCQMSIEPVISPPYAFRQITKYYFN